MNEIKEKINIEDMIYEIRGKQVMLDSDLAKLYQCKNGTKSINLAVKRNIERFPNDFYFQLSDAEYKNLKFHFETSNLNSYGGIRKLPFVFTEEGVAMLSSVLKTEVASIVSINIMRAFVKLRKYISNDLLNIKNMLIRHDNDIKPLQESFSKLEKKEITKKFSLLKDIDIKKYNKQYGNLVIKYDNTFHDRYFILDKKLVYHLCSSINHAGSKTFSINKIEDEFVIESLIRKVNI